MNKPLVIVLLGWALFWVACFVASEVHMVARGAKDTWPWARKIHSLITKRS